MKELYLSDDWFGFKPGMVPANKGIPHSEEERAKMRAHHYDCSGDNNSRARKVVCLETGEIFGSIKSAKDKYNVDVKNAVRNSNGCHYTHDTHWLYLDEYESMSEADIEYIKQLKPVPVNLGRDFSKDHRKHIGDAHRGSKNSRAKKILCIETGDVFGSLGEALEWCKGKYTAVLSACCRGLRKDAYGYHWQYYGG